jgi:hypothetical protein
MDYCNALSRRTQYLAQGLISSLDPLKEEPWGANLTRIAIRRKNHGRLLPVWADERYG